MTSTYLKFKEQSVRRVFEDRIVAALETGNVAAAKTRFAEAREFLNTASLSSLVTVANEYGVSVL